MTVSFSTSRLAFVDSKLVGTKLGKYLAHLPDGEDDPHGGPAEDVAHVHGEAGEEAGAGHAVLAAAGL